jgi:DNA-binding MarR family transcriptional regulator
MPLNGTQADLGRETSSIQPPEIQFHVVRRMRRAFLSMCRCGDALFSPYRMTTDQYALMRAVQREPGIRQADLGAAIFAEPNTVTAMVTLLEKRGILRRRPSPTDGRARLISLTAHGEKVMQRLSDDWDPMRKLLNECFSVPEGQEALRILDRIYEGMRVEREKLIRPSGQRLSVGAALTIEKKSKRVSVKTVAPIKSARTIKQDRPPGKAIHRKTKLVEQPSNRPIAR